MKPVIIIAIAFVLLIPVDVFAISVSEIEKKLLEAQSEEDVESVILEIVKSSEYRQACQLLEDKLNSLPPPEKTQAYLDKSLGILQDWETLKCQYTKNEWKPQEVKISNLTREECDDIFQSKAILLDQYHEMLPNIITGNEPDFVKVALEQDILDKQWQAECRSFEYFKGDIICGTGTIEKNGQCVPDYPDTEPSSRGGGCLIATATYGSELSTQVQQLRELRDNQLLNTESGINFMNTFNDFYYSFSPIIADYERENLVFREMVKIAITPMISSLSILNYVDMNSEVEVLGYGISLIILNGMMYVGIPILAIMRLNSILHN